MDNIKQILIENGIKPTFQRIKIIEYLRQNHNHPTVDMIYEALYRRLPTLSKTTIYNTLDVLREKGLVNVLTITESEKHYDYFIQNHHHFLCTMCGRIIDLDVDCPYMKQMEYDGYKIEEIHGYFKGICNNCLDKSK